VPYRHLVFNAELVIFNDACLPRARVSIFVVVGDTVKGPLVVAVELGYSLKFNSTSTSPS
jgi:hypothetical protein